MTTIEEILAYQIRHHGNIADHLLTLQRLALECEHVTEVGVHNGGSIWAWLSARPKVLRAYDRNPISVDLARQLKEQAEQLNVDFVFQAVSILTVEIDETDLLFIDTLHTYKQLSMELHLHAEKARKYIVMHDTSTFGYMDGAVEGEGAPPPALEAFYATLPDKLGLQPAVDEFLANNPHWTLKAFYPNNHGLTVLERKAPAPAA